MSATALADERFSRAGGAVAALIAAIPIAAMGSATLIAPFILLAALIATDWMRLPVGLTGAGLPLYIAIAFAVWVVLSTLRADKGIDTQGAYDLVAFAPVAILLVAAAGLVRPVDRALAQRAAIAGVGLLVAVLAIETNFDYPIGRQLTPEAHDATFFIAQKNEKGEEAAAPPAQKLRNSDARLFYPDTARAALVMLCCLWGACAILARSGWPGWLAMIGLFGVVAWIGLFYGVGVHTAALVFGLVAAVLALIWPRATVSLTAQTMAALIVFAPILFPAAADLSARIMASLALWKPEGAEPLAPPPFAFLDPPFGWVHRAHGWAHAGALIREHLIGGWGFGASAQFNERFILRGFEVPFLPGHPQNTPIQIWLETGAIGALLAAGALASFGRRAGAALADDRVAAAAATGLLVSAAVIANVIGGAWSVWWWGALAFGAILVRVAKRPS